MGAERRGGERVCVSPGFIKHNVFKMPGLGAWSGLFLSVSLGTGSDGCRPQSAEDLRSRGRVYADWTHEHNSSVSGSGVAPTPTSALLQGPHEPGRSNKGRLLSSSPVSPSASAGRGTWEEPAAACGVCGRSVKSENCFRALITYKAGYCYPGKNSLYLHLPP